MTNRTWIGGGNNRADNPNNWSPTGVPQPGDNMWMPQGIMNISGDYSQMALSLQGSDTVNLANGSSVVATVYPGPATINVRGTDHLSLSVGFPGSGVFTPFNATVNLAANSQWVGSFGVYGASQTDSALLLVNGSNGSSFSDNGPSIVQGSLGHAVIDADMTGTGIVRVTEGGVLEVGKSVGSGQTVLLYGPSTFQPTLFAGTLQIDHPTQFAGDVNLTGGQIDLEGLTKADSYTFQSDILKIFAGNEIIDTLRLTDSTPYGFKVEKTESSVNVIPIVDSNPPTGLPIHPNPITHIEDQTTGTSFDIPGDPYNGPVPGIDWQYIVPANLISDNLNITSLADNVFIHSGSGDDALDMSGHNGRNVLDGSTGSNFMTAGGSGYDEFYVDDRSPSSNIWTTVRGMGVGDNATIWGITQQDFAMMTTGNDVLPIAPGLDFSLREQGKPDVNLTLSDYHTSDLPQSMGGNGRLGISFGTVENNNYTQIHANS